MRTLARFMAGFLIALVLPSGAVAQPQTWLPWKSGEHHVTSAGKGAHPNTGLLKDAFEFRMPAGNAIIASAPGTVESVVAGCSVGQQRCGHGYGNNLLVCYSDGSCSRYAHLSSVSVTPGQQVTQAQLVGSSGQTGRGSVPALHYQVEDQSTRSGMAHIGDQSVYDDPRTPFGGVGASGNGGRFGGDANLDEFTQWRWISERDSPAQYPF